MFDEDSEDDKNGDSNEIDIYDNLNEFDFGTELAKLKDKNTYLEASIEKYKYEIEVLRKENEELLTRDKYTAETISKLVKTAKAEITRKNSQIVELNKKLDDVFFRRFKPFKGNKLNVKSTYYQTSKENIFRNTSDDIFEIQDPTHQNNTKKSLHTSADTEDYKKRKRSPSPAEQPNIVSEVSYSKARPEEKRHCRTIANGNKCNSSNSEFLKNEKNITPSITSTGNKSRSKSSSRTDINSDTKFKTKENRSQSSLRTENNENNIHSDFKFDQKGRRSKTPSRVENNENGKHSDTEFKRSEHRSKSSSRNGNNNNDKQNDSKFEQKEYRSKSSSRIANNEDGKRSDTELERKVHRSKSSSRTENHKNDKHSDTKFEQKEHSFKSSLRIEHKENNKRSDTEFERKEHRSRSSQRHNTRNRYGRKLESPVRRSRSPIPVDNTKVMSYYDDENEGETYKGRSRYERQPSKHGDNSQAEMPQHSDNEDRRRVKGDSRQRTISTNRCKSRLRDLSNDRLHSNKEEKGLRPRTNKNRQPLITTKCTRPRKFSESSSGIAVDARKGRVNKASSTDTNEDSKSCRVKTRDERSLKDVSSLYLERKRLRLELKRDQLRQPARYIWVNPRNRDSRQKLNGKSETDEMTEINPANVHNETKVKVKSTSAQKLLEPSELEEGEITDESDIDMSDIHADTVTSSACNNQKETINKINLRKNPMPRDLNLSHQSVKEKCVEESNLKSLPTSESPVSVRHKSKDLNKQTLPENSKRSHSQTRNNQKKDVTVSSLAIGHDTHNTEHLNTLDSEPEPNIGINKEDAKLAAKITEAQHNIRRLSQEVANCILKETQDLSTEKSEESRTLEIGNKCEIMHVDIDKMAASSDNSNHECILNIPVEKQSKASVSYSPDGAIVPVTKSESILDHSLKTVDELARSGISEVSKENTICHLSLHSVTATEIPNHELLVPEGIAVNSHNIHQSQSAETLKLNEEKKLNTLELESQFGTETETQHKNQRAPTALSNPILEEPKGLSKTEKAAHATTKLESACENEEVDNVEALKERNVEPNGFSRTEKQADATNKLQSVCENEELGNVERNSTRNRNSKDNDFNRSEKHIEEKLLKVPLSSLVPSKILEPVLDLDNYVIPKKSSTQVKESKKRDITDKTIENPEQKVAKNQSDKNKKRVTRANTKIETMQKRLLRGRSEEVELVKSRKKKASEAKKSDDARKRVRRSKSHPKEVSSTVSAAATGNIASLLHKMAKVQNSTKHENSFKETERNYLSEINGGSPVRMILVVEEGKSVDINLTTGESCECTSTSTVTVTVTHTDPDSTDSYKPCETHLEASTTRHDSENLETINDHKVVQNNSSVVTDEVNQSKKNNANKNVKNTKLKKESRYQNIENRLAKLFDPVDEAEVLSYTKGQKVLLPSSNENKKEELLTTTPTKELLKPRSNDIQIDDVTLQEKASSRYENGDSATSLPVESITNRTSDEKNLKALESKLDSLKKTITDLNNRKKKRTTHRTPEEDKKVSSQKECSFNHESSTVKLIKQEKSATNSDDTAALKIKPDTEEKRKSCSRTVTHIDVDAASVEETDFVIRNKNDLGCLEGNCSIVPRSESDPDKSLNIDVNSKPTTNCVLKTSLSFNSFEAFSKNSSLDFPPPTHELTHDGEIALFHLDDQSISDFDSNMLSLVHGIGTDGDISLDVTKLIKSNGDNEVSLKEKPSSTKDLRQNNVEGDVEISESGQSEGKTANDEEVRTETITVSPDKPRLSATQFFGVPLRRKRVRIVRIVDE